MHKRTRDPLDNHPTTLSGIQPERGIPQFVCVPLPFHHEKNNPEANQPTDFAAHRYYRLPLKHHLSQEWEIRRLREASVTSDGMLSCYTPFLLAIVKRRARAPPPPPPPPSETAEAVSLSAEATPDGNSSGISAGIGGGRQSPPRTSAVAVSEVARSGAVVEGPGKRPGDGGVGASSSWYSSSSSCPRALCVEALWALSEYAALSPGLAAAEVLPLAEGLASDTREHSQVVI